MRGDLDSLLRGILIKTDRGSCARRSCYPATFVGSAWFNRSMDFGEQCFDTAALFDVQIFFQGAHFMANLVVFPTELQRGGAANSPDFPTELALAPHFIAPAR